jgi:hypothetical protein
VFHAILFAKTGRRLFKSVPDHIHRHSQWKHVRSMGQLRKFRRKREQPWSVCLISALHRQRRSRTYCKASHSHACIYDMTTRCRNTYPRSKTGAVLVLLFEQGGVLRVLLTTRSKHLRSHPGQVITFIPIGLGVLKANQTLLALDCVAGRKARAAGFLRCRNSSVYACVTIHEYPFSVHSFGRLKRNVGLIQNHRTCSMSLHCHHFCRRYVCIIHHVSHSYLP